MNLFKLILKAVWFLMVSMVGIALIMMIYQAIEDGALVRAFDAKVNWDALSAIGTLLAVLVALAFPIVESIKSKRRTANLIESEIRRNFLVIRGMRTTESVTLPGPENIVLSALDQHEALRGSIDLRLWEEFRYKLASTSPALFQRYEKINRHAEAILDAKKEDNMSMRVVITSNESKGFVNCYESYFGSSDER